MQVLETERLVLRRLTPEDAAFILELLNDPLFLHFVGDKGVRTREDAVEYIRHGPVASYSQHGFGLFLVSLKADGTPIGMCGLLKRAVLEDVDVGFGFLSRYGGNGYATEAAAATVSYGRRLGIRRIVAITAPDNVASGNVLRKIGLHHTQTLPLPGYKEPSLLFTPVDQVTARPDAALRPPSPIAPPPDRRATAG
ncbi:Protein N-acetyltransferase, RimJ/RimL family [Opitutus sp. GAS368]|nr:Protein N-acetyltransferase, RimJ/RimL family [Opitutus sp. GAS368]